MVRVPRPTASGSTGGRLPAHPNHHQPAARPPPPSGPRHRRCAGRSRDGSVPPRAARPARHRRHPGAWPRSPAIGGNNMRARIRCPAAADFAGDGPPPPDTCGPGPYSRPIPNPIPEPVVSASVNVQSENGTASRPAGVVLCCVWPLPPAATRTGPRRSPHCSLESRIAPQLRPPRRGCSSLSSSIRRVTGAALTRRASTPDADNGHAAANADTHAHGDTDRRHGRDFATRTSAALQIPAGSVRRASCHRRRRRTA